ncbi:MAG: hypothetical protein II644_02220 [Paludibacteraceae bacterium]|nr:hypothetical protein [Paludibacteraceae bacterium]
MEKKIYMSPLVEVAKINMNVSVLAGSPPDGTDPALPPHPGVPGRRWSDVF